MNLKNKYLLNTLRILFGVFMLFSGVTGLLSGPTSDNVPIEMAIYTQVLWDAGIMQYIKVAEVIAGLMLIVNFLPALAMLIIAPISLGILIFLGRVAPGYLPTGIVVVILTAYFGYVYFDKYKALFMCTKSKPKTAAKATKKAKK